MNSRYLSTLLWLFFSLWLAAQLPFFFAFTERGMVPIDFLAYQRAAEALENGESRYLSPAQSVAIFRYLHQSEAELLAAHARGEGYQFLQGLIARPQQPGPYVYPPSLALLIAQLNVHFLVFIGLILLSILGFTALWFKSTQAHSLWLLLVIGSRDVLASLQGGNVELLLLFVTVLAARCLWDQRLLPAAFLITLVLLIKPFYALFFVAFMLLREVSPIVEARVKPRSLAPLMTVILALIAVEIYRWGSVVRAETLNFLLHATDYLWFALPVAEQTPLSMWNRTPLQGLINAGVPVSLAQMAALGLWLLFLGITLWWARKTPLTFPLTFALALTLLYWGRPAGYGFNYLEVVVAVVVWPTLQRWQKPVFLAEVAAVMASRWWALAQTLRGEGMALLTLQSATFPWETWLVLPLSWLLLLRDMRHTIPSAQVQTRKVAVGEESGRICSDNG